jgi:hypothetical protein
MSWPDEPCPACPRRDLGGCRAQRLRNATLCRHAADGHEAYRALLARGDEGPREATTPDPHAGRELLIRGCDYRLDAVGLERGEGCGCTPMTRCLLGRGKWGDDPGAIDYGDCLECMS